MPELKRDMNPQRQEMYPRQGKFLKKSDHTVGTPCKTIKHQSQRENLESNKKEKTDHLLHNDRGLTAVFQQKQ